MKLFKKKKNADKSINQIPVEIIHDCLFNYSEKLLHDTQEILEKLYAEKLDYDKMRNNQPSMDDLKKYGFYSNPNMSNYLSLLDRIKCHEETIKTINHFIINYPYKFLFISDSHKSIIENVVTFNDDQFLLKTEMEDDIYYYDKPISQEVIDIINKININPDDEYYIHGNNYITADQYIEKVNNIRKINNKTLINSKSDLYGEEYNKFLVLDVSLFYSGDINYNKSPLSILTFTDYNYSLLLKTVSYNGRKHYLIITEL